jgi:hypothetical protein
MGYASWTSDKEARAHEDDPTFIEQKQLQWPEPIILRFNKKEYRVYLIVEDGPNPYPKFEGPFSYEDASNYTEVIAALPTHINPNWHAGEPNVIKHYYNQLIDPIEKYFNISKTPKRNIVFSFTREIEL